MVLQPHENDSAGSEASCWRDHGRPGQATGGRGWVAVASVSTLELNDERGTAKAATVERAMVALDMERWDTVLPAPELAALLAKAEDMVGTVAWQMALEGQPIGDETVAKLVRAFVGEWVARATS